VFSIVALTGDLVVPDERPELLAGTAPASVDGPAPAADPDPDPDPDPEQFTCAPAPDAMHAIPPPVAPAVVLELGLSLLAKAPKPCNTAPMPARTAATAPTIAMVLPFDFFLPRPVVLGGRGADGPVWLMSAPDPGGRGQTTSK
jgi:hypothetical protein